MKHIRLEVPVGEHEGNADGGYRREKREETLQALLMTRYRGVELAQLSVPWV